MPICRAASFGSGRILPVGRRPAPLLSTLSLMTAVMSEELYNAMFRRRSVRRYMPGPLDPEMMRAVSSFTASMRPLFPDIRVELRFLGEEDVGGMFKVAAPHYLALYSEKKEGKEANAGFLLQQADLFLSANGLGSCWQGGPRPVRGTQRPSGLDHVVMLAFGRAAEKVHRDRSKFRRKEISDITDLADHREILEAARIAPSGLNNQSWFFNGGGGMVHGHAARSAVTGPMNRINVGIALSHMRLAAEHEGYRAAFAIREDGRHSAPRGYAYVASMDLQ